MGSGEVGESGDEGEGGRRRRKERKCVSVCVSRGRKKKTTQTFFSFPTNQPHTRTIRYDTILTLGSFRSVLSGTIVENDPRMYLEAVSAFGHGGVEGGKTEDARLVSGKIVRKIVLGAKTAALECGFPAAGILPLKAVALLLSESEGELTSAHAPLVLACVMSGHYAEGYEVYKSLSVESVSPSATGVTPQDMLEYYYYSGVCATAVKEYDDALEAYTLLFSVPGEAVSAIMVEAYKKYMLVSLVAHGEVAPLPKYVLNSFTRHVRAFCAPYTAIKDAFKSGSRSALDEALAGGAEALQEDKNWGLAKLTRKALVRNRIARLTQTYITVSLGSIAESVGLESPEEAFQTVSEMIQESQIYATINEATGMVEFLSDPQAYDDVATLHKLNATIESCAALAAQVRALDAELLLSNDYIYKTELAHRRVGGDMDDLLSMTSGMESGGRGRGRSGRARKGGPSDEPY